jgi:hypothetical protein
MHTYPADFISGAVAMGHLVAGLFFLRFWRRTGDSLFLIFAIAFWLLTANVAAFSLGGIPRGDGWVYLLRLAAFVLIIAAIVNKNLRHKGR